ncbi:MAG: DNA-directed RNA polymerase subunit A' [Thermoplasmata archaeon]|jgi:DNA-directed RNA polymerase subunit A'
MIETEVKKRISGLKFALLSPDEIRRMSAIKITTADTYDEEGYPIDRGLMDLHLGVIEPGLRCKTCNGTVKECPGHYGHIELAMPVIHIGYVKEIKEILESTCSSCGRIKLKDDELAVYRPILEKTILNGEESLEALDIVRKIISEASARDVCPHCGAEQHKITLDKPTTFRENGKKLSPKEIRERFEKIPDDDLIFLGLNPKSARPEWMILTVLTVPPVNVRPTITLETGERSEDDLTHKLVDIIRINQRLRDSKDSGAPQLIIEDLWELLQYHVTTYFDNQTSGLPPARHRSGRPLKTLVQRLKGKEGRFRANLSGKRVNFSARTVISPEPFLSINEVGVPEEAARELTVPVTVTPYNIKELKEIVRRGPNPKGDKYLPGANYVLKISEGSKRDRTKILESNAEKVANDLEVGMIVERHLMDGDIVLFNRQPSLHRMSMMAHKVRIMKGKTFRFNLADCPPYNADFDGDEMNLHVIQSEEARAEAKVLMLVQEHIRSPRFGGPIIGGVHDHITGLFLLTYRNPLIPKELALHILSYVKYEDLPEPVEKDGKLYYRGKDIFSLILPKDLNIEYKSAVCKGFGCQECKFANCPYDAYVVIRNGKLLAGTIDKASVAAFDGILINKISKNYSPSETVKFIDNMTRLSIGVISSLGFTTGIDDSDIPEETQYQIDEIFNNALVDVDKLIDSYQKGLLTPSPGKSLEETLEERIMKVLSDAQKRAGDIVGRHLGLNNPTVIMARSGARASVLNLAQVIASMGQQSVRGKRIHRGYLGRTLPHFKKGDLGAFARGFVKSSLKKGMNPTEYFFQSIGGREGLVDTAVRTSRSGYMQRRLINALEDLKVTEDMYVMDTSENLIQLYYGEDGVDPMRSMNGNSIDYDGIFYKVMGEEFYKKMRGEK